MNPPNGQTPLDYLNQIAPQAPKKPLLKFTMRNVLLGALVAIVIVIIMGVVGSSLTLARVEPWERLSARLAVTAKIVDASTGKIKNSQLRSINSDTKLYITNTQRDLAKQLAALSINSEKLPKSILASESGQAMATRLENGRLNAKYDSTYAREMTYRLATLLALLQQLYGTNVTEATKDSLKSWYDNLLPIYKSVSEFSASNE